MCYAYLNVGFKMNFKNVVIAINTILLSFYAIAGNSLLLVDTKQGKIRGIESESALIGEKYYSFLGIPYGKPPVGNLRFQPPEPSEKWEGILNATKEGNPCPQTLLGNTLTLLITYGNEDCLYLNVYTPQLPSEIQVSKAVMVFIHGGAFAYGTGSRTVYSPDFLIKHDVIVVTMNYRLHALGFLNLGIRNASGNYGLKDQLLALKWVRQNIDRFGGDPENITLFGISAGGASAHFHTLSPLSKGLFHKAIIQSAHALSQWALNPNPIEWGFKLGRLLGFQGSDSEELVQYLKTQPADRITYVAQEIQFGKVNESPNTGLVTFSPSVETLKEDAFLPNSPENLIQTTTRTIPVMIGFTEYEGILNMIHSDHETVARVEKDFPSTIKTIFDGIDGSRLDRIATKVKKHYFGDRAISKETKFELLKFWSSLANLRLYETIDSKTSSQFPSYVYQFAYSGHMNVGKQYLNQFLQLDYNGTTHGDDVAYLFYISAVFKPSSLKPDDLSIIYYLCSMWTNFAKTGNPTHDMDVEWKPSTVSNPAYLRISSELEMVEGRVDEQDRSFWTELFKYENLTFQNSRYIYNSSQENEGIWTTLIEIKYQLIVRALSNVASKVSEVFNLFL